MHGERGERGDLMTNVDGGVATVAENWQVTLTYRTSTSAPRSLPAAPIEHRFMRIFSPLSAAFVLARVCEA